MTNPVIAEVTRGRRVECVHRGAYAVLDADGAIIASAGDIETPIFVRSSMKLMQALPVVESGAADALGFLDKHLALLCASHSSSPTHIETCADMLARSGLAEHDLQCGAHYPMFRVEDTLEAGRSGVKPNRMFNNCSGKHAGFLAGCAHCGHETKNYLELNHPWQRDVRNTLEMVCDFKIGPDHITNDGCSAPTYALPLRGFALGFAQLLSGTLPSFSRNQAAKRLSQAAMTHPILVAGEGRFDTELMTIGQGRVFAKCGAEGVQVAAIPDLGIALAAKCDDGAARGVEVLTARLLADTALEMGDRALADALRPITRRPVETFAQQHVGWIQAVLA